MIGEVRQLLRRTVRLEIARRCHHNPPHVTHRTRDHTGIRQMADAHGKVDPFIHETYRPVRQAQFGADIRILFQIGRHHRADMQPSEHQRRRDNQPARWFTAFGLD